MCNYLLLLLLVWLTLAMMLKGICLFVCASVRLSGNSLRCSKQVCFFCTTSINKPGIPEPVTWPIRWCTGSLSFASYSSTFALTNVRRWRHLWAFDLDFDLTSQWISEVCRWRCCEWCHKEWELVVLVTCVLSVLRLCVDVIFFGCTQSTCRRKPVNSLPCRFLLSVPMTEIIAGGHGRKRFD